MTRKFPFITLLISCVCYLTLSTNTFAERQRPPKHTLNLPIKNNSCERSSLAFRNSCAKSNGMAASDTFTSTKPAQFNLDTFNDEFLNSIPNVKGYVFMLTGPDGETLLSHAEGIAREANAPEGYLEFNLDTKTSWASISKVITTAAALHAIRHTNANLDDPISLYLPSKWIIHSDFSDVTPRLLLQHRGGFLDTASSSWSMRPRLEAGSAGECENDICAVVGERRYANASMALFRYIIPYMLNPSDLAQAEIASEQSINPNNTLSNVVAFDYRYYVIDNFFTPLEITGFCNIEEFKHYFNDLNFTYRFINANDDNGVKSISYNLSCSERGWALSIRDLMKFLWALKYTQTILTQEEFELMENKNAPDDRLALGINNECYEGPCFVHGGLLKSGVPGYTTSSLIYYPDGKIALLNVNSGNDQGDYIKSGDLTTILIDAYNTAYGQ